MKQNKTILEKIGISQKEVNKWKKAGLKVTYPIKKRRKFFKSDDGEAFVEAGDKFIPPLTEQERKLYTKSPEKFREDFLKNVRFHNKFLDFLYEVQKRTDNLEKEEKLTDLLSLLYLFQASIDHHYWHFDRYLVYENYPQTPVGYWWKKLKDLYTKATKEKILKSKSTEKFLKLLAMDGKIIKEFKKNLSRKNFIQLKKTLNAIKIFEKVQREEIEICIDAETKIERNFKVGLALWDKLCNTIKTSPELVKKRNFSEIKKILEYHPIIGVRKILLSDSIKYFDNKVIFELEKEIKRWS
jgi:hypothetical protein